MIDFEQFSEAGTAEAAGLFVPISDLPGLDALELDGSTLGSDKAVLAILNAFYDTLSPSSFDKLGISVSKPNPVGQGSDLIAQNYSAIFDFMADHETLSLDVIPEPVTGVNSGVGVVALADIFPNATAVAAAGATTAGIVIPNTEVGDYGAPVAASIPSDARQYLASLYHYIVSEAVTRTAETASGITAKSRGAATGFTPPPAWTATTDPISGVTALDLPKLSFFRVTLSITVQLLLSQETQTFDVNSVTS